MPRIIDKNNMNNFGVLFINTKDIEQIQEDSGMGGSYTKEYQVHYYAAIGRLQAENQILDIAIPLVYYNYPQQVSGAHIGFHLDDVNDAADEVELEAIGAFEKLQNTDFFKYLVSEFGLVDWTITKFNSWHCHPNGIDRFSGVDYGKDYNNPGVVFPMQSGENEPLFAGIVQHINTYAELIHNEYRIFNNDKNDNAIYEEGRCLTIIKGFHTEPPQPIEMVPGPIDEIFGTTPPKPKPKPYKRRKDYILRKYLDKEEGKELAEILLTKWKECNFETTIFVDKGNIGKPIKGEKIDIGWKDKWRDELYRENSLFGYSTHRAHKSDENRDPLIKKLISFGYSIIDIKELSYDELEELINIELEEREKDERRKIQSKGLYPGWDEI